MSPASRQPTRIGNARPSQLMFAAGIGAVVDLPGMSVVVRGLDSWGARGLPISEPRLLTRVQEALPSGGVTELRAAPYDPDASDDPFTSVGVPVTTFPRWMRCPACHQLLAVDGTDQLQLEHRWGRRPDLAKWVHRNCPTQASRAVSKRRSCIPARFLVACNRGHLDEFPYVDFVHQSGKPCPGPQLEMRDAGSTLGPRVTVACTACGSRRNISQASGTKGARNLPQCRGRHPHLQSFEPCAEQLKLLVLGASNLWFGETVSALHLPDEDPIAVTVREHWDVLSAIADVRVLSSVIAGMPVLHALGDLTEGELRVAIETECQRRVEADTTAPTPGLLEAEWQLLSHPTTVKQDDDFRAVPTPSPDGYRTLLEQVVKVDRLREVQAMIGFSRIDAGGPDSPDQSRRAPLSLGHPHWAPAVERRGEGIFLELREDSVARWCDRVADHRYIDALRGAFGRWSANRDRPVDSEFPVARYLLVHTLSHLLLRQVALECGYSSASIKERLYVGSPSKPTAGILLSTAASDSEGTLGGLVALGERRFLGRLLDQAIEDAQTCSSDPLCAERVPEDPSDHLYIAACHACLFASETSCEAGNRWLHRGVLADLGDGLVFER